MAIGRQENVLALQIPMNDVFRMNKSLGLVNVRWLKEEGKTYSTALAISYATLMRVSQVNSAVLFSNSRRSPPSMNLIYLLKLQQYNKIESRAHTV